MSNLYDQIAEVCASPHGWCTELKARTLASLVIGTRPDTIVEIGVWSGRSLLPMALACREIGHGMVIGIDPYEPAASVLGQCGANAEWWASGRSHQEMHDLFLSQVNQMGLQNVTRLIRKRSDDVEPPVNIGLISVDGNHSRQVLKDVERFGPAVRRGGFLVLDDLHWDGGAVLAAGEWLEQNGFTELYRVTTALDDWAVFQKLK